MSASFVSAANLESGIRFWHDKKPTWPRDFHASFYAELAAMQAGGLDDAWWRAVVPHLASWRANRPKRRDHILDRGLERLQDLRAAHGGLVAKAGAPLSMSALEWGDVAALFEVARSIKGVQSPVFGSKLCHFVAPAAFPVVDGEAVGALASYEPYWRSCRDAWLGCEERPLLVSRLRAEIGAATDYPFETKVVELCAIGRRWPTPSGVEP